MTSIISFTLSAIIQCILFNYLIISNSSLISQEKYSKKRTLIAIIVISIFTIIEVLIKNIAPTLNTLLSSINVFVASILVFKINIVKSILIFVITFLEVVVTELISVSISVAIFKTTFEEISNLPLKMLFVVVLQAILAILLGISIKILVANKSKIRDFFSTVKGKHIVSFAIVTAICIVPKLFVLMIYKYEYPPVTLFIDAIQFLIICVFIFSYLMKSIENEKAQSDLFTSELHNRTLIGMVDGVRTLKHDYNNIMQALNGYVATKQYDKLQAHINNVLKECNIVNNLSVIDPKIFNEPSIYGIVGSKFFLANEADITFDLDITTNIAEISFPMPELSRILGILLDNAIEATKKVDNQYIRLEMKYDNRKCADTIRVINTYDTSIDINLVNIYKKGYSTKEVKSGIGLWEVKKLISKNKNSQIFPTIEGDKFVQNIIIEKL